MKCPKCGASMVERKNRQTGAAFMGCSSYPNCQRTISVGSQTNYRSTFRYSTWASEQEAELQRGDDYETFSDYQG